MTMPLFLFDSVFDATAPTVSSTATGFDAANLTDWRLYTYWKPSSLTATITTDAGSARAADYMLLCGGDFTGLTITLRGSTDNFSTSNVVLATVVGTADKNLFVYLNTPATYRYWRIQIAGATAPSVSIAAIGTALEMPHNLGEGYDPLAREEEGARNLNENGYPLGIVAKYETFDRNLSFQFTEWAFLRSSWLAAWDKIKVRPFAFVWDADGHPDEVDIVMSDGKFTAPHNSDGTATIGMRVTGVPTLFDGVVI